MRSSRLLPGPGLLLALLTLFGISPVFRAHRLAAQAAQAPAERAATVTPAERGRVIESLAQALDTGYVFPAVGRRLAADLRARAKRGEYDRIADAEAFADRLTGDLAAIAHDKHLHVEYYDRWPAWAMAEPDGADTAAAAAAERERRTFGARRNYGFDTVERLPGNVGYLKISGFYGLADGGETAAAAMRFLAGTDALIVDLRGNHGGEPDMIAFVLGYLLPKHVHLNDLVARGDSSVERWYTPAYVPGQRDLAKPVWVLTDSMTVSAGEEFAYDVQTQKRGTIVGDTTAGAANPGRTVRVGDHFGVFVPNAYARNPITGDNWEGKGVRPDVVVPAERALATAHAAALRTLLTKPGVDAKWRAALERALAEATATGR